MLRDLGHRTQKPWGPRAQRQTANPVPLHRAFWKPVAGAKKGPIPTEGMMLLGPDDAPLVEEALEEGTEPKTVEGFGVGAGATLLLAPEPEPEAEAEAEAPEGGAE